MIKIIVLIIFGMIILSKIITVNINKKILGTTSCVYFNIPAYFDTSFWNTATGNSLSGSILIMNPNSGPGLAIDSSYTAKIQNAKNKQAKVLGYVHTSYGGVSLIDAKNEIDKYKSWYGITDIFFDEVASTSDFYSYYQDLANYVHKTQGSIVELNTGVYPAEGYMNIGDIILSYEDTYDRYASASIPNWANNYPANKFAHLIYAVSTPTNMKSVFATAKQRNVGYIYITNDDLPNPWDSLPPYWNDQILISTNSCTASTPTLIPTLIPTIKPTIKPTSIPTLTPAPTLVPTQIPTTFPTIKPTVKPTSIPTLAPTPTQIPKKPTPTVKVIENPRPTRKPFIIHFKNIWNRYFH